MTEVASLETSFTQIGSTQIGSTETSLKQIGSTQVGSTQVGSSEISLPQDRVPQISTTEICSNKTQVVNPGIAQINFLQVSPFQHLSNSAEFNFTEISLPSSITLQQLLSSHNPNPQNTTVPTWTDSIQASTPFNLKIEVSNLPTEQLAEAQITSLDASGMPNLGTIFIDDDANGKGCFLDSTPLDNSEFASSNAANYFQADVNCAA